MQLTGGTSIPLQSHWGDTLALLVYKNQLRVQDVSHVQPMARPKLLMIDKFNSVVCRNVSMSEAFLPFTVLVNKSLVSWPTLEWVSILVRQKH